MALKKGHNSFARAWFESQSEEVVVCPGHSEQDASSRFRRLHRPATDLRLTCSSMWGIFRSQAWVERGMGFMWSGRGQSGDDLLEGVVGGGRPVLGDSTFGQMQVVSRCGTG
jgi:hypothetical protein